MTDRRKFVVLSNAVPGRAHELREWYEEVHLPDARAIPGVAGAALFETLRVTGMPPSTHAFMAIYDLDGDPSAVWTEFERRIADGEMAVTDALDAASMSFAVWAPLPDAVSSAAVTEHR